MSGRARNPFHHVQRWMDQTQELSMRPVWNQKSMYVNLLQERTRTQTMVFS